MLNNTIEYLARCFVVITCFCASLLIMQNDVVDGYEYSVYMPILYMLSFLMLFKGRVSKDRPIFFIIFFGVGFIRYVLFPLLVSEFQGYSGRSPLEPSIHSYNTAIGLMCYELIVVTVFMLCVEYKKGRNKIIEKTNLSFNPLFSLLIFLTSLLLLFIYPDALGLISFVLPSTEKMEASLSVKIIVLFFIVVKQIFFMTLIYLLSLRYRRSGAVSLLWVSLLLVVINTLIYFGTNRIDILLTGIVSFIFLVKLFGRKAIKYVVLLIPVLISALVIITSYRGYVDAGVEGKVQDYSQVYFGGVYNVAIGAEVPIYTPEAENIEVLFFDFIRPMVGVSLLIKDLDIKYSNEYFNERMWVGGDRMSQIIPMIAQGYLFFGFVFAPLLSIIFVVIYYMNEKLLLLVSYIEIKYFIVLVMARQGFLMGQNSMNLINDMSLNFFMVFFVYLAFILTRVFVRK